MVKFDDLSGILINLCMKPSKTVAPNEIIYFECYFTSIFHCHWFKLLVLFVAMVIVTQSTIGMTKKNPFNHHRLNVTMAKSTIEFYVCPIKVQNYSKFEFQTFSLSSWFCSFHTPAKQYWKGKIKTDDFQKYPNIMAKHSTFQFPFQQFNAIFIYVHRTHNCTIRFELTEKRT